MSLNRRYTCAHRSSSRRFLFFLLLLLAPATILAGIVRMAPSSSAEATSKSLTTTPIQSQCVTPPAGMLAWYPGDGHNNDIQGGNHGVTAGSVPYAAGEVSQAFQFNGANGNAVVAPEQAAYQVTSLSIDAWIKIAGFPTATQGAGMIYFRGDNRPDLDPYFLYTAPGGKVGFHIGASDGSRVDITAIAPANQWIHVAGTFDDPSNTIRLYINGALAAQQTTTLVPMTIMPAANNPGVSIGNIHISPFSTPFNGLIDEVELFGRALTQAEIQGLYNAGVDGKCKPDADADGVTDALDACPGTPSGTSVNAAGCPAGECLTPPTDMVAWFPGDFSNNEIVGANSGTTNGAINFAAGEVNQAFQFNGATGNAVSAAEQLAYQVTSFSVDSWVKIAGFPSASQGSGMIFFRGDSRPALDPYFLYSAPGGKVGFHIESATGSIVQIEAPAPANQWIHVTGTFDDPSNTIRLYVNGVLVAQQITSVVPMTNMIGANPGVSIGNINVTPFSVPFNGLIDEVELFARALTSAEVQGLYLAGAPGKCKSDADGDGVLDPFDACPATPLGTSVNSAGCTLNECFTSPAGMVAWYPGDGNTNDIQGGHNPSATNAVSFVPGIVGQGFDFGTGGYIDIPGSPAFTNQQFTLDAWARPDGPGPNNDGNGSVIVQKNINVLSGNQTSLQLVWRGTDNRFVFNAYNVQVATGSSFQLGQFYHVAGTYDGTTARIYVNGTLQGQVVQATTIVYDNSVPYTIGSNFSGFRALGFSRTWDGVIDEVEIFNRALAASEINAIYSARSAGKCRPDADGDGVANEVDNCPLNANPDQANNDGDSQGDVCDADDDNDTVPDTADNCPLAANTDQANNDGDAQGDVCDADDDNDTVSDTTDNCPLTANTDQANNDGDAQGDVCDADDDNDGVPDATDNCALTSNPDQANNDGDAQGDACDADDDNDTVPDTSDNCPLTANTDQANNDGDAQGDVCDADDDNDGTPDATDNCPFVSNSDQADADHDSQGDACDADDDNDGVADTADLCPNTPSGTQVNSAGCPDGDGDGITDSSDNCAALPNADQADFDHDGQGDACDSDDDNDGVSDSADLCPGTAPNTQVNAAGCADADGDGVADADDNCPSTLNAAQADLDHDGQGDACDADDDGDGVDDGADNCPVNANPAQEDADGDGLGNACDANPNDGPTGDLDGDGVVNNADNCPTTANPDQLNTDGDAEGDICDTDDDNDGIPDATDNCPLVSNSSQQDTDHDGLGNACDTDDDGDGFSDAVETAAGSDPLNPASTPEVCDGVDNDLNDGVDEGFTNTDGDSQADCVDADDDNDGQTDVDETACGSNPLSSASKATDTDGDNRPDCVDADDDGDGVPDGADNCPLTANATQADNDHDGVGDTCDPDDDNDLVLDSVDNCPLTSNPGQQDSDHDGIGDTCDPPSGPLYGICPLYDQEKTHKGGSTIPIKLQLCDAGGHNLSSPAIVVTAIGVMKISDTAFGSVEDSGNANPDFNFRYDPASAGYTFNLSTKGLGTGTYRLGFKAGSDPTIYTVQFRVK